MKKKEREREREREGEGNCYLLWRLAIDSAIHLSETFRRS